MIAIEHMKMIYPDKTTAIMDLSLHISAGEHVALVGANGAGKTSLLLALAGVLPAKGRIVMNDILLERKNLTKIRNSVGMVFQNPDDQLFMPVIEEDIAFGLRHLGLPEQEVQRRIEDTLEQLQIAHLRKRTTLKLSGGEKRMAALATVLVMKPPVLLLDEPTAFLDPKARRRFIETLQVLSETMLVATHDLTFAAEVCPRSVLLKNGDIFADGPSKDLLYDVALMDACGVEAIM